MGCVSQFLSATVTLDSLFTKIQNTVLNQNTSSHKNEITRLFIPSHLETNNLHFGKLNCFVNQ